MSKYTKKSDDKMDAYLTRKLDKEEKAEFEKKDKAHGKKKKPKTLQEDVKVDRKIIKGIKKKEAKPTPAIQSSKPVPPL